MKNLLLIFTFVFTGCSTTALSVVEQRYKNDANVSLSEITNNGYTSLIYASSYSQGCAYRDQYLLMKGSAKEWKIIKSQIVQDCHKKSFREMKERLSGKK